MQNFARHLQKKATKHTNTTKKNNKRAGELHADTEKALHSVTESGAASSSALSSLQDSLDKKCKVLEQRVEDYEKLAMNVLHQEGAEGPTSEQWKTLQESYARLSLSYQDLRKECELKNYKDGLMEQLQDKLNKQQRVLNNKKDENEKLKTQVQRDLGLKRHLYSAHRHNKKLEKELSKKQALGGDLPMSKQRMDSSNEEDFMSCTEHGCEHGNNEETPTEGATDVKLAEVKEEQQEPEPTEGNLVDVNPTEVEEKTESELEEESEEELEEESEESEKESEKFEDEPEQEYAQKSYGCMHKESDHRESDVAFSLPDYTMGVVQAPVHNAMLQQLMALEQQTHSTAETLEPEG